MTMIGFYMRIMKHMMKASGSEMILVWLLLGIMIWITMMAAINIAVDRETEDREQEEWIKEWNSTRHTTDTKKSSNEP